MKSGDDGAHAALVSRDGGEDNTLGKDAFLEEASAELHGEGTFTDDDGGNRRFTVACIET